MHKMAANTDKQIVMLQETPHKIPEVHKE